jgi:hypothetical protein
VAFQLSDEDNSTFLIFLCRYVQELCLGYLLVRQALLQLEQELQAVPLLALSVKAQWEGQLLPEPQVGWRELNQKWCSQQVMLGARPTIHGSSLSSPQHEHVTMISMR